MYVQVVNVYISLELHAYERVNKWDRECGIPFQHACARVHIHTRTCSMSVHTFSPCSQGNFVYSISLSVLYDYDYESRSHIEKTENNSS